MTASKISTVTPEDLRNVFTAAQEMTRLKREIAALQERLAVNAAEIEIDHGLFIYYDGKVIKK